MEASCLNGSALSISSASYVVRRPLILVVDDDEDNLLLITYALECFGYACLSISNGEAALSIAAEQQPDLILLDIVLPEPNGIEVFRRLQKDSKTRTIPVVAVTALAREDDRTNILSVGFADYLSKPYMLEDLDAILQRRLCKGHKATIVAS